MFKHFGVRISKKQLSKFGIVKVKETGSFVEVTFLSSILIDFLAAIHAHVGDEEINDFGKNKLLSVLPFLCGLAGGTNKGPVKKEPLGSPNAVVTKLIDALTGFPPSREPDYYIKYNHKEI